MDGISKLAAELTAMRLEFEAENDAADKRRLEAVLREQRRVWANNPGKAYDPKSNTVGVSVAGKVVL